MATSEATGGDANLVSRAVGGDQQAFAEIYDRYADSIYSFCRSRLRSEADAADATQDTFVRAVTRISQLRDPHKLRAWLYAIARNEIVSTARISGHSLGDEAMVHVVSSDPEPDVDLLRVESAAQLWAAAGGLKDRDHEVLELHLRHGLVGQNLADALGVSEPHANVMLSRMRDRIATSLGSLLVARQGREDCGELDAVLDGWDGQFTLAIRSQVTRHTKSCEVCERTRGAALASSLSFGVLPMVAAPRFLRDLTVDSMAGASAAAMGTDPSGSGVGDDGSDPMKLRPSEDWSWREDGFPGGAVARASRRGLWIMSAAAATVIVALGATLYTLRDSGSDVVVDAVGGAAIASSVPPTALQEPSSSEIPVATANSNGTSGLVTSTAVRASPGSTEADNTVVSPILTPATPQTTTTAASPDTTAELTVAAESAANSQQTTTVVTEPTPSPPTTAEPVTTTSSTGTSTSTSSTSTSSTTSTTVASQNVPPTVVVIVARPDPVEAAQGRCTGETSLVFAEASDGDGDVISVVARWSFDGINFGESSMLDATGVYTGLVGPWAVAGTQVVEVVATDNEGAEAASSIKLTVTACPIDRLTLTP